MNQQMFRTRTAQALVSLLFGCLLLSATTAWCAGGKNPHPGDSTTAAAAVKEVKADKKLKPQARVGKVQQTLAMRTNQELLALLQETRMEMPAYQHLVRMRPAPKANVGPTASNLPAGPAGRAQAPIGRAQVRQALETALNRPEDRHFIVSMLSNYMLNNSAY